MLAVRLGPVLGYLLSLPWPAGRRQRRRGPSLLVHWTRLSRQRPCYTAPDTRGFPKESEFYQVVLRVEAAFHYFTFIHLTRAQTGLFSSTTSPMGGDDGKCVKDVQDVLFGSRAEAWGEGKRWLEEPRFQYRCFCCCFPV